MDDAQLREQLDRVLTDSGPPPLGSLVADSLVAGGKLRRRRRFAVIAGSTTGIMALAVAGVAFASNGGGAGSSVEVKPGATGNPTPTAAAAAKKATTGEAVIALLTELLPPGGTISEIQGGSDTGRVAGSFLYDDGHGAATVFATVADKPADYGTEVTGMRCPPDAAGFVCQHSVAPDGVEIRVMTMGPYSTDCTELKCSLKDLRVEIRRPDGIYVTAESTSGPFGGGRAATRADTLLNTEQLLALARDSRWGLSMDASFVERAGQTVHLPHNGGADDVKPSKS